MLPLGAMISPRMIDVQLILVTRLLGSGFLLASIGSKKWYLEIEIHRTLRGYDQ